MKDNVTQMYDTFEYLIYLAKKSSSQVTTFYMNSNTKSQMPIPTYRGIPIKLDDALPDWHARATGD